MRFFYISDNTGPNGDPLATPSFCLEMLFSNVKLTILVHNTRITLYPSLLIVVYVSFRSSNLSKSSFWAKWKHCGKESNINWYQFIIIAYFFSSSFVYNVFCAFRFFGGFYCIRSNFVYNFGFNFFVTYIK